MTPNPDPAGRMRLCAVVPTYNNAGTLEDVLMRTYRVLPDIIVVNDGSTDDTQHRLAASPIPVIVVELAENRGKGYALREGFRKARACGYTHALTIDSDGQHYPEDIPLLTQEALLHPEAFIIGSRPLKNKNMPQANTFANKFSNFWFRLQTGCSLPDTQTGFRLYPLSGIRGTRWLTSRYEAELELLVFAAWQGTELRPVTVRVFYPDKEHRISHFRPTADFLRISLLNTALCFGAVIYGWPRKLFRRIRNRKQ
ncbi:glycosyltransferase family 2 protein [uncultured Alistipes sp.]|uniref:glycosyltransferase family 2 protein n=1 Tax=uncultured Alistipes sp. TaxID=538949 RepID=UPI002583F2C0|nr:glycosyltransferase family 2 protein [uncultured Alistipes sp.]